MAAMEVVEGVLARERDRPMQCVGKAGRSGYALGDLDPIATFYVSQGGSTERILLIGRQRRGISVGAARLPGSTDSACAPLI
jgi:hypothetical protein